ncbi:MAG: M48 family metallopeptidase [Spirochaeta sp.]
MEAVQCSNRHSVTYGRRIIEFSLFFCDRKTMEIAVEPDSTVVVKAPEQSDIEHIKKKIHRRARWIIRQQNFFRRFDPRTPARSYVSGETHQYLGKHYRLKIVRGTANTVKLSRGCFYITCRNEPTPEVVRNLLHAWYLEKAWLHFAESLDRCMQKFNGLGVDRPALAIKQMRKRWGSLSDKGTITLNTDLIRAPKECIDYVVTHELCHLKHHDHSHEFYTLLSTVAPDWERIKDKLELAMV